MHKEIKFYKTLLDDFIGEKIEVEIKTTPLISVETPLQDGNFEIEFEDRTKIKHKGLEYILIKSLICYE
jgi:hypothetical protein